VPPLIEENEYVPVVEEKQVLIEVEEQQEEQQEEIQAYQPTPRYHAMSQIAHRELEPWLADYRKHFWHHFEEEQRIFYEQHREAHQQEIQQQQQHDEVKIIIINDGDVGNIIPIEGEAEENVEVFR
jgi:hypothetical protein